MKRGGPLRRRARLLSRVDLKRRDRARATEKAELRERSHRTRMEELRPRVFARALWKCEAAGLLPGRCEPFLNAHHRLMRSQGGPDTMANLVALCGSGTTGHHGWVHAHPDEAYLLGLLIRSWNGPPTHEWAAEQEWLHGEYDIDPWA